MKKTVLIFVLFLSFATNFNVLAQDKVELTEADLVEFRESAAQKITDFMDYLPKVANTKDSQGKTYAKKNRLHYKDAILQLFKDEGKTCNIEVGWAGKNKTLESFKTNLITYLDDLINANHDRTKNKKLDKVEISFAETFYVSNFYPIGKNKYAATATFYQKFSGYTAEGKPKFENVSKKIVQIEIELFESPSGDIWILKLGDISITQAFSLID